MNKKECSVCGGNIKRNKCVQCGLSENSNASSKFSEVDFNDNEQGFAEVENNSNGQEFAENNSYGDELYEQEKKQQTYQNTHVNSGTKKKKSKDFAKHILMIVLFLVTMYIVVIIVAEWAQGGQSKNKIEGNAEIVDFAKNKKNYEFLEDTMSETGENYNKVVINGNYKVGVHIPEGIYTIKTINTNSQFGVDDAKNGIHIIEYNYDFDKDERAENIEYRNVYLFDGATLEVYSPGSMELISENAQTSTLKKIEPNAVKETIEIKNEYIAGIDFPEGTYNIELDPSDDDLYSIKYESYDDYGIKSTTRDKEKTTHYNIEFKKGTKVTFENMEVKFTTSEFNTIGVGNDTE